LLCALTLLLSVASFSGAPEQKNTATARAVKTRLAEVFALCQSGNTEAAARYFVYRGADKSRQWKDTFRAADAAEMLEVKEVCRRIKGYLEQSEGYSVGAVKVERESEGVWHVLEVSFRQGEQIKKVLFAFLPIKGRFSIGDID
jgi:hypothetical protein